MSMKWVDKIASIFQPRGFSISLTATPRRRTTSERQLFAMDHLPNEIINLIYRHIPGGKTLTFGSLLSRRFRDALWHDNNFWKLAYLEDFGEAPTHLIELYGDFRYIRHNIQPPPSPPIDIAWRQKYRDHREFLLRTVHAERKRRIKKLIMTHRQLTGLQPHLLFNCWNWTVMNLLMSFVALPLLFVLLILRVEGVTDWSFHTVLAPADFILLCGLCHFLYLVIISNQRREFLVGWFIVAIFPVAIATIHWAAACGDWMTTSGGDRPVSLNWMVIFSPGLAMALLSIILTVGLLKSDPDLQPEESVHFRVVVPLLLLWLWNPEGKKWQEFIGGAETTPPSVSKIDNIM
ncbi:hypothetical protein PAPYR_4783 [Paratrimastix pyriformis]|uniref:F-box domain-containing protein n=1 Tax=Paratrimastix pyriformis TaxID=342808 RepID=A0ABQ8UJ53_9EUKA|nr:hypothetical protein PAPYR_4783 [Paratrimastix pyriformis]